MKTIDINGNVFDLDDLSDNAKNCINTIRFIDSEIERLQNLIKIQQAARTVYANLLQKELETVKK